MKRKLPYRGGKVHVLAQQCQTCIFRPGNLMQLRPSRLREMIDQARLNESAIVCHSTLDGAEAVCRSFFDRHATAPLQIAERLGLIVFQEVPL